MWTVVFMLVARLAVERVDTHDTHSVRCPVPPKTDYYHCDVFTDRCDTDSDCSEDGEELCCPSLCGRLCKFPVLKSVGCPLPPKSDFTYCNVFTDRCDTNYDCSEDGEELCCPSNCGRLCKSAVSIKRGSCPKYRYFNPSDCSVRADKCFKDSDCRGMLPDRACPFFSPKAIYCPAVLKEPSCKDDSDCPLDEKCCAVACDNACVKSNEIIVNPGTCPSVDKAILCGFDVTECGQDGDCEGERKCCDGPCGKTCELVKPKPGFCPEDFDGSCPLRDECTVDQRCDGDLKCCRSDSNCGKVCLEPDNEGRQCPYDKPLVNCFVNPCTVTFCPIPNTRCVANYCGGCNAVFYNSSGHVVDCTPRRG